MKVLSITEFSAFIKAVDSHRFIFASSNQCENVALKSISMINIYENIHVSISPSVIGFSGLGGSIAFYNVHKVILRDDFHVGTVFEIVCLNTDNRGSSEVKYSITAD